MKKILGIVLVISIALALSSCGTQAAATSNTSNSAAYSAGSSIGSALKSMYSEYKSTGKINLKSTTNLIHMAAIATSYQSIKSNLKDKTIYKDLASGLIAGSKKSVTESTVDSVISTLGNIDISSLVNKVKSADESTTAGVSTITNATSSISSLLKLLK